MKTVGEMIFHFRTLKGISLEDLSARTRIDIRYIKALEVNDYRHLPSPTFTKGFIRNIAIVLDRDPNELIAIFRRDYQVTKENKKLINKSQLNLSRNSVINSQVPLIVLGALLFFGYLGYQYRTVIIPPKLEIVQPRASQVVASPVTIEGLSSADSVITINDQEETNVDHSGHFITQLSLSPGTTDLKISASNRFGRTSVKIIPITIISQ